MRRDEVAEAQARADAAEMAKIQLSLQLAQVLCHAMDILCDCQTASSQQTLQTVTRKSTCDWLAASNSRCLMTHRWPRRARLQQTWPRSPPRHRSTPVASPSSTSCGTGELRRKPACITRQRCSTVCRRPLCVVFA